MKIGIDARWVFTEKTGIGIYTVGLIRHLALLDSKNSYVLFFDEPFLRDRTMDEAGLHGAPNFQVKMVPHGVFSVQNQLSLPRMLAREGLDVFHSLNYMIPVLAFPRRKHGKTKCVVTIHDVIPMIFPRHAPQSRKAKLYPIYHRLMIEVGARASAIITVSDASRKDLLEQLRIPADEGSKVKTIYNGVSERFRPAAHMKPDTTDKNILFVGRVDPYKNLEELIRAFAKIREKNLFPITLTVAGPRDERYPEAPNTAKELGVDDAVNWTGYISDEDLVCAYQQADVLVHPSRYEGFGLQVVEAMACGTPVICGNGGALPEVAGDAGLVLDPNDIDNMARQIEQVLSDRQLAAEMTRKGFQQASKFTWERVAQQVLEVYENTATPV